MPNFKTCLLGATLALGLPVLAMAQSDATPATEVTADTVLATVNGTDITLGHLIVAAQGLSPEEQQYPNDVLLSGLRDRLIQQTAISSAQDTLSKATQLKLENERSALIASDTVEAMAAAMDIQEADLKAAYDAKYSDFTPPKEFNAAHILVATEDEAKALVTELEGGADFAELAKLKSTGPSGPGGGDLGWFVRGQMVEAFQDAVEDLEVGGISAPIETQFGWHVIKLIETRIPDVPKFEDISNELQAEVFRDKMIEGVGAIVEKVEVERTDLSGIDPAVIRDLSLIAQ